MEGVQNLSPHQQQAFMREMENMQLKDSLSYVPLLHLWFDDQMMIRPKRACLLPVFSSYA